jgi:hypothetical protein
MIRVVGTLLVLVLCATPAFAIDSKHFVGYWMGIDPTDGGDTRRGITENANGTFSVVGRDSFLTLCDGTDRGLASFSDGVANDGEMTTSNAVR